MAKDDIDKCCSGVTVKSWLFLNIGVVEGALFGISVEGGTSLAIPVELERLKCERSHRSINLKELYSNEKQTS
jgi:hypothetical protein